MPTGLVAATDEALAEVPGAALDALKKSIEQFAATVTGPTMEATGAGLQSVAHGVQVLSAAVGDSGGQASHGGGGGRARR